MEFMLFMFLGALFGIIIMFVLLELYSIYCILLHDLQDKAEEGGQVNE